MFKFSCLSCHKRKAEVMIDWHNGTVPGPPEDERSVEERSKCVLAYIPVIYYSALLCIGVPGTKTWVWVGSVTHSHGKSDHSHLACFDEEGHGGFVQ